MVPSLRRAGLRLRWMPDFRHEAVRTILRLSGWTFGLVVRPTRWRWWWCSPCPRRWGPGAVSAYTYAYTFFQLPYGIVAVSIMSATAPELTARWAMGDLEAFRRRMGTGLRTMLAIVIPAAAGELILARPLVALVVGHGAAAGERTALHGTGPRHVGPRPARVLRLPLRRARPAERAGPALGVLAVCPRERDQHRAGRGPGGSLRRARHRLSRSAPPTRWPPWWRWATCAPASRGWAGTSWAGPSATSCCQRARSWWRPSWAATCRGPSPRSCSWPGGAGPWPGGVAYVLAAGGLAELARRRGGGPWPPRRGRGRGRRGPGRRRDRRWRLEPAATDGLPGPAPVAGPGPRRGPNRSLRRGVPLRPTRLGPTRAPDPGVRPTTTPRCSRLGS